MTYVIRVDYRTGDSFRFYDDFEILDYGWHDEEVVKENAKAIIDHYHAYDEEHGQYYRKDTPDWGEIKKQWWYADPYFKGYNIEANMKLKLDNKDLVNYTCPWCGFFETLDRVEIKVKEYILEP